MTLTGPTTANEGQLKSYSFSLTDPGTGETFSVANESCGAGNMLSNASFNSSTGAGSFDCTFADGPSSPSVTVTISDGEPSNNTGTRFPHRHRLQRRPVDRDQRQRERERGLGLQPDAGRGHRSGQDTVTSYVVHWGDGNSDTYSTNGAKTHTYADGPASQPITVDLVDEDGTFLDRANAKSVSVDNVAPSIAISGATNVNEGSVYTLTLGAVTDPGTDTVSSYVVHWGDGNTTPTRPTARRRTPTPTARPRSRSPSTSIDEDGTFLDRANAKSVSVDNVAPSIAISGATNVNEGSVYTPDPGRGHRPGSRTPSPTTSSIGATATRAHYATNGAKTHTYADGDSDHAITVDLTDEDGTFLDRANAKSVHVDNVAPSISISGATNVNEGSVYTLTLGAVTDPGTDTVTSYVVHWGDGSDDTYSSNGAKTHTYADGPASRSITVDLVDEDGTFLDRANAKSVTVDNVAPSIAISGATNVNEGSTYTLTLGAVTDPGTDTVTTTSSTGATAADDTYGSNGAKTHTYADGDATRAITVDLTDEDGTFLDRANAKSVSVDNVAPSIAISGATNVNEGSVYTLTLGAVTDPGQDTVTDYVVHWGDGNTSHYATSGAKTHTYADGDATRAITVDLTDEDGTFARPREREVGQRRQRRSVDRDQRHTRTSTRARSTR